MSRLVFLAMVSALFSCSTAPDQSGLFSDSDNLLTERTREMYYDGNNSRRARTVCTYSDGSILKVEGGFNCPSVFPDED